MSEPQPKPLHPYRSPSPPHPGECEKCGRKITSPACLRINPARCDLCLPYDAPEPPALLAEKLDALRLQRNRLGDAAALAAETQRLQESLRGAEARIEDLRAVLEQIVDAEVEDGRRNSYAAQIARGALRGDRDRV